MVEALIGGVQDAEALAALARGRLRAKLPVLRQALDGLDTPIEGLSILAHIDFIEESSEQVQQKIEQRLPPFEEAVKLVESILAIQEVAAAALIAEIGTEMTCFASAKHLASWAGAVRAPSKVGASGSVEPPAQQTPTCERFWAREPGPSLT